MNLNQVTVPTLDVPRAIAFYEKLGLNLIVHTHDGYARFECPLGESTFSVLRVDKLSLTEGAYIYFEVDDVASKVEELESLGFVFEQTTTDQVWLWTEARLNDPDGNVIIIYYAGKNRKNPPWRKVD